MHGPAIPSEESFEHGPYTRPIMIWRRQVLRETVQAFENAQPPDHYERLAQQNLERWRAGADPAGAPQLKVVAGDWGDVTLSVTRECGVTFAVLNMANAYCPGGAYVEGASAQEENMFRRTNCHFSIAGSDMQPDTGLYRAEMTALLNAEKGRVYLDTSIPRVCIRGAEIPGRDHLGYEWLPEDEVFPFFELRSAAKDYRDGSDFDEDDARRRIRAQLDTLMEHDIRHAVFGASGCGAFLNPSERIASIYRAELGARREALTYIVFAIYSAGYGPGNFEPFSQVLGRAW